MHQYQIVFTLTHRESKVFCGTLGTFISNNIVIAWTFSTTIITFYSLRALKITFTGYTIKLLLKTSKDKKYWNSEVHTFWIREIIIPRFTLVTEVSSDQIGFTGTFSSLSITNKAGWSIRITITFWNLVYNQGISLQIEAMWIITMTIRKRVVTNSAGITLVPLDVTLTVTFSCHCITS